MAIYLGKYIEANINSDNSSDDKIEQLIDILKESLSLSKVTKDYDIEKVNDLITIILSVKVIHFFIHSKHYNNTIPINRMVVDFLKCSSECYLLLILMIMKIPMNALT
jgi:hypothetical protein